MQHFAFCIHNSKCEISVEIISHFCQWENVTIFAQNLHLESYEMCFIFRKLWNRCNKDESFLSFSIKYFFIQHIEKKVSYVIQKSDMEGNIYSVLVFSCNQSSILIFLLLRNFELHTKNGMRLNSKMIKYDFWENFL